MGDSPRLLVGKVTLVRCADHCCQMCPALRERVTGCHLLCHPCWKWRGVYKEQKQKTCCVTSNRNGKHILYLVTHFDIQNPIGLSERYAAWIKVLEQLATSSFRWTQSLRLTVTEIDGLLYCCDLGLTVNESIASSSYTPVDRFQFRLWAFCAGGKKEKKKIAWATFPKWNSVVRWKVCWQDEVETLKYWTFFLIMTSYQPSDGRLWNLSCNETSLTQPIYPLEIFFFFFFFLFFKLQLQKQRWTLELQHPTIWQMAPDRHW